MLGLLVAVVVGVGALIYFTKNVVQDAGTLVQLNSHHTIGPNAKVTLVEFGDYQCPACGAAYPVVKKVLEDFKGNLNVDFVFRNFPLVQHQNAQIAAEAAESAGEQGKFWEMHDMIYEHQDQWSTALDALPILVGYAQQLKLDVNKFKDSVTSKKFADVIQADSDDGVKLGVNSTPTFFLNGVEMVGVPDSQDLKDKINSLLK